MTDREKSRGQKKPEHVHKVPKEKRDDDASDELSIEELEEAAGGTGYQSPDPNAAC